MASTIQKANNTSNNDYASQNASGSAAQTSNSGANAAVVDTLTEAARGQSWASNYITALDQSSLDTGVATGQQSNPFADLTPDQISSAKNILWNALQNAGEGSAWSQLYAAGLTGDASPQQTASTGNGSATSSSTGSAVSTGAASGGAGGGVAAAVSTTIGSYHPAATANPGTLPPADVNGQGEAYQVSGLDQRKQMVIQACVNNGITDPTRQAQILAAGLLEGNLDKNTDPKSLGVFNLNSAMANAVGMGSLVPQLQDTGNLSTNINASVQVVNAALNNGQNWFTSYQRGGSTLNADPTGQAGTYQYAQYQAAYNNTVSYIQSGSGLTDDYRYAENVPAV